MKDFVTILRSAESEEELEALKKIMRPMQPTLAAIRTSRSHLRSKQTNQPHNKKIQPQRRLFSTKNKPKRKKCVLRKPTTEEQLKLAINMLN